MGVFFKDHLQPLEGSGPNCGALSSITVSAPILSRSSSPVTGCRNGTRGAWRLRQKMVTQGKYTPRAHGNEHRLVHGTRTDQPDTTVCRVTPLAETVGYYCVRPVPWEGQAASRLPFPIAALLSFLTNFCDCPKAVRRCLKTTANAARFASLDRTTSALPPGGSPPRPAKGRRRNYYFIHPPRRSR